MVFVDKLTVRVDQKKVVNNFSLQVMPGSVHAIMGQNGSGKSSLAYTLIGFSQYTLVAGTIQYKGHDITSMSIPDRSKLGIFLAFQQPLTIPGVTVFTFLQQIFNASGKQASPAEFELLVHSFCKQVGLDLSLLYRGLNENFSGGEKKRLEIIQMLVLQPQLIILDEIDSGLDVDALRAIGMVVKHYLQQNPQAACIIITHHRRILDYIQPDFVHIMHAGTIVTTGDAALSHQIEQHGYEAYAG